MLVRQAHIKMRNYVLIKTICSLDAHLLDKPLGATNLVDNEHNVTDVADDVATEGLVKLDVGHRREPCAVEVDADKLTLGVDYGRA